MASCLRIRRILLISFALGCSIFMISTCGNIISRRLVFGNNGYITTKFDQSMLGRLGNHMFELIALIGLADQLDRTPYIEGHHSFIKGKVWQNIQQQFPSLVEQFKMFDWKMPATSVKFHGSSTCCTWDDPERLKGETGTYIQLDGQFFQSYKYFDHMRNQIRKWLLPDEATQTRMQSSFPSNFKNRFLICVHIRREDFVTNQQKDPSDAKFSVNALVYLIKKYSEPGRKMGAVILGNEVTWERETFGKIPQTHIVEGSTPEEDFALTRFYCDVVLITAPSSSFGWFLGYLSKKMDVYYRDINDTNDMTKIEMKSEDFFLPMWTKLKHLNGTVVEVAEKSHKPK